MIFLTHLYCGYTKKFNTYKIKILTLSVCNTLLQTPSLKVLFQGVLASTGTTGATEARNSFWTD